MIKAISDISDLLNQPTARFSPIRRLVVAITEACEFSQDFLHVFGSQVTNERGDFILILGFCRNDYICIKLSRACEYFVCSVSVVFAYMAAKQN